MVVVAGVVVVVESRGVSAQSVPSMHLTLPSDSLSNAGGKISLSGLAPACASPMSQQYYMHLIIKLAMTSTITCT